MMILIINKNYHSYDVFENLTVKNVTAIKIYFRLLSTTNKQKYASAAWNYLKSQINKYVNQSKKYSKIWLKKFHYDFSLSVEKKGYVFFELTVDFFNKETKKKLRKSDTINYDSYDFVKLADINWWGVLRERELCFRCM